MFWTVEQTAFYLRMELHQVYYLLVMGYMEAVKVGPKLWRIPPEGVREYAKRQPQGKDWETAGHFIYKGNGGLLFDSLPDRVPHDPERRTPGLERRGRELVCPPGRSQNVLFKTVKPVNQLELFTS
ncbi:MAG: helix-turn-helix domain-containing protein [Treponema sp.]|nr:helix-turn-helix domain-containing protein [Treponema sp.]